MGKVVKDQPTRERYFWMLPMEGRPNGLAAALFLVPWAAESNAEEDGGKPELSEFAGQTAYLLIRALSGICFPNNRPYVTIIIFFTMVVIPIYVKKGAIHIRPIALIVDEKNRDLKGIGDEQNTGAYCF